ncbi:unnamed protein product [Linum trigynum]|uniref:Uncharacterized protein n=1 Tax=Linum trigynum TaxID=586398 RepID=A0AAV2EW26_9ROSI
MSFVFSALASGDRRKVVQIPALLRRSSSLLLSPAACSSLPPLLKNARQPVTVGGGDCRFGEGDKIADQIDGGSQKKVESASERDFVHHVDLELWGRVLVGRGI